MPRTPIDYSKIVIYKIVCNDLSIQDCYVGSTTSFVKRKRTHKCYAISEDKRDSNYKVYQTIRENGGWDNWTMIEIEKYPCNDSNEATKRERHWYEELNAKLNLQVPNRSKTEHAKQYSEKNRDKINKYRKEYKIKNREKVREADKQYHIKNRDKINEKKRERRRLKKLSQSSTSEDSS